ncbi:MAG: glutaminyl-peptide cyclotransferase [Acidimicrobiaceae bacterium]|nr:glutaminyl-peptide cyclotransferase [Acidimicrobiaceae bacterium]
MTIETSWRHDTDAFTQGLETHDGIIYESTGLYGQSRLRALDGPEELRSVGLDPGLFGEGLTLVGSEIVQLSWREGRALRWDRETFELLGEFRYDGEGWGICWDHVGSRLLMSDGTATLTHRDPDDFEVVATTTVTRNDEPVRRINELECVDGLVVANIWMTNEIIVIDPDSGETLASIDAASLAAEAGVSADETHAVLNGVAYQGDGKWILGGKNWPMQFLVTLTVG